MKWGKKQLIVDENGQSVTVKGTDGTVYVQGTSDVTVTVGSYSTNVDTSGAATADSCPTTPWTRHKPTQ